MHEFKKGKALLIMFQYLGKITGKIQVDDYMMQKAMVRFYENKKNISNIITG